jgi:hypothetical protein
MNLDVDFLIDFFRKHTPIKKNKPLDEQDAPDAAPAPAPEPSAPSSGGGGGGGSTGGAAPSSGKTPKKWETGLTRGKANPVGNTKWESGRTLGKTYMNDPHYQWTSGRQMGSTGGSDY